MDEAKNVGIVIRKYGIRQYVELSFKVYAFVGIHVCVYAYLFICF